MSQREPEREREKEVRERRWGELGGAEMGRVGGRERRGSLRERESGTEEEGRVGVGSRWR